MTIKKYGYPINLGLQLKKYTENLHGLSICSIISASASPSTITPMIVVDLKTTKRRQIGISQLHRISNHHIYFILITENIEVENYKSYK